MINKSLSLLTVALAASLAGGVCQAAGSDPAPTAGTSSAQTTTSQNLPQEIRQKLEQDGFSNVNVVPGSFLVSAKDKRGDPVTMVIGPNSMTVFSQVSPQSSTTGAANSGSADH